MVGMVLLVLGTAVPSCASETPRARNIIPTDPRRSLQFTRRRTGRPDVEPIEINAGAWYLRALRADGLLDDRPALADLGETDPDHVDVAATEWSADTCYRWAVCDPTTGELLAEVALRPATGEVRSRARAGFDEAAAAATESVRRFARALGLGS
jgi:hypothetical protein